MKTTKGLEKELNKYIEEHNPDLILMHPKTLKRLWLVNYVNNHDTNSLNKLTFLLSNRETRWKEFKKKPRYAGKIIITSKDMKKDEFRYFIKQRIQNEN